MIPSEFGNLINLIELDISRNNLAGSIPSELGNLSNLRLLRLSGNNLGGSIPSELGNLTNLRVLSLSGNNLEGAVPAELGNLTNLEVLTFSDNNLTGQMPLSLTKLRSLRTFFVDTSLCAPPDTPFQSWINRIPDGNRDTTQSVCSDQAEELSFDKSVLVTLYRSTNGENWANNTNWLSDRIHGEWHGVVTDSGFRVVGLSFLENNLTGQIPAELGNLTNLEVLTFSDNNLTGQVPAKLGNLKNVASLDFSNNNLTGQIPAELGNLANLVMLDLSNNNLAGPIPQSLTELTALTRFHFRGTGLCVPSDDAFQTWLDGISDVDERDAVCAALPSTGDAVVSPGLALALGVVGGALLILLGTAALGARRFRGAAQAALR